MADNLQIKQFSGAPECFLKPDAKDIYHCTKSQIVELFESPILNQQTPASVYVVDLSVVMRTRAARLKGKELHLTFREWLLSILNGVSSMGIIEAFICHCYGNKTCNNVDELRYYLFRTSINNSFRDLSPSNIGPFYQVLRSCFQAGWVWGNTFIQEKTPCVSEFG